MIYQLLVLTVIVLFLINLSLNLLSLKHPSKKARLPEKPPRVSVLIPARNEEDNVGKCLESILRQDYPNFEALVLDDNSTDKTSQIVGEIEARDGRAHLIKGKPLPEGWTGKCFACHQLSQHASGEWLLFVDADTVSEPHMISGTLEIAVQNGIAMLSGFPRQQVPGITQKVVLPVLFYFAQMTWFPIWWFHLSRKPRPTMVIGQFLLFNRQDYFRIGGHEAVRSKIIEDMWFGIEMSRHGGRTLSVDLSNTLSTGMYNNVASMTEGCIKWFYSIAAISPLALIGFVVAAYIFYLAPFYWLYIAPWDAFIAGQPVHAISIVIAAQVFLLLLMRLFTDLYFRGSAISFIFHPLGAAFLILAVIYGALRRFMGAGVAWKDRVYQSITHIK